MENLNNRFKFHSVEKTEEEKMNNIRDLVLSVAENIDKLCPDGREKSLAITNLEQVMFWANASISRK